MRTSLSINIIKNIEEKIENVVLHELQKVLHPKILPMTIDRI